MKEKLAAFSLIVSLMLSLSGCFFRGAEELYALPKSSETYVELQETINKVKGDADYIAPQNGSNTQTIQLVDLNGDGVQEAVAFFKDSNQAKDLIIYIFKQDDKGNYQIYSHIEDSGTGIASVDYLNMGGTETKEMVVSWQVSASVHTLVTYGFYQGNVVEMMRSGYTEYLAEDVDGDNEMELLLMQMDVSSPRTNRVEYYDYDNGAMTLKSSAQISDGAAEIASFQAGQLRGNEPALFVTSDYGDNGQITDIFCLKDGSLKNITLDKETGQSSETIRYYTGMEPRDIDGDGITEVPQPQRLKSDSTSSTASADNFWIIKWRQYDSQGENWLIMTTYHNNTDRWYLILPENWTNCITLSRRDNTASGERAVVFSYWTGTEDTTPEDFLIIYRLTGSDRETLVKEKGWITLKADSDTIYAAELIPDSWNCGLDEAQLQSNFNLITTEWLT